MITPWNWPINQLVVKAFPAFATGCTMVHKPSEVAPFTAHLLAEVFHESGLPAGVYNLLHLGNCLALINAQVTESRSAQVSWSAFSGRVIANSLAPGQCRARPCRFCGRW